MVFSSFRLRSAGSVFIASLLSSCILMFGLQYLTPYYPLAVGLLYMGLAGFTLRYGVNFDPMIILLTMFLNWSNNEIKCNRQFAGNFLWSIGFFVISLVSHFLGGLLFWALNEGVPLNAAYAPQSLIYTAGTEPLLIVTALVFCLISYHIHALTTLYSRDGYGATAARFFSQAAIGWIFFFVGRDVLHFGLGLAIIGARGADFSNGVFWYIVIGEFAAVLLTWGLYGWIFRYNASPKAKNRDSSGDAVLLDSHISRIDPDICEMPKDYYAWQQAKRAGYDKANGMDSDDTAPMMKSNARKRQMKALV